MHIVYTDFQTMPTLHRAVGDFVSMLIWGDPERIRNYRSLAVFAEHGLIAGMLFHNHDPATGVVEMSSAAVSKLWITRPVMNAAFSGLAFGHLGCQMVALRVSERNKPMIRIARHIGFSEVKIPRLRGRNEAEYIFTLTDDAWRSSRFFKEGPRDGKA